ncbi:MAG: hypothetical protein JWR81_344 [Pseudonocardia sp.]|nr:hypothetical protein [Pseudonocardia sp.]
MVPGGLLGGGPGVVVVGAVVVGGAEVGGPAVVLGEPPGGTRALLEVVGVAVVVPAAGVVGVDVELHETAPMMIAITTTTAATIHIHKRRGEPPAGGGGGGGGLGGGEPYPPSVP